MSADRAGRFAQIRATIKATAARDPKFVPLLVAVPLLAFAVVFALGLLIGAEIVFTILAVIAAVVAALVVIGRRASKAAFAGLEGQPGAAAAILMSMRGHWHVTPAVGLTRSQDFVHRVIGRPGVILVAEGAGARPKELLAAESRKVRRAIGETPLYDVVVGDGAGQIPLKRLQVHLMKLPRNLKPREVNELERKLKAMGSMSMPLPKGPLPKGARMPRGKIR
jgi:hypothetical protein